MRTNVLDVGSFLIAEIVDVTDGVQPLTYKHKIHLINGKMHESTVVDALGKIIVEVNGAILVPVGKGYYINDFKEFEPGNPEGKVLRIKVRQKAGMRFCLFALKLCFLTFPRWFRVLIPMVTRSR